MAEFQICTLHVIINLLVTNSDALVIRIAALIFGFQMSVEAIGGKLTIEYWLEITEPFPCNSND